MSTIYRYKKVVLPRRSASEFWERVEEEFDRIKRPQWEALAMLVMKEVMGWKQPWIASAFGCTEGTVCRQLATLRKLLTKHFCRETGPVDGWSDDGVRSSSGASAVETQYFQNVAAAARNQRSSDSLS